MHSSRAANRSAETKPKSGRKVTFSVLPIHVYALQPSYGATSADSLMRDNANTRKTARRKNTKGRNKIPKKETKRKRKKNKRKAKKRKKRKATIRF